LLTFAAVAATGDGLVAVAPASDVEEDEEVLVVLTASSSSLLRLSSLSEDDEEDEEEEDDDEDEEESSLGTAGNFGDIGGSGADAFTSVFCFFARGSFGWMDFSASLLESESSLSLLLLLDEEEDSEEEEEEDAFFGSGIHCHFPPPRTSFEAGGFRFFAWYAVTTVAAASGSPNCSRSKSAMAMTCWYSNADAAEEEDMMDI
jgi:hypothetical protein